MQSRQTPEGVRLRKELHEEVDRQLRIFGIEPSDDLAAQRDKADDIVVNWLGQNSDGPPQEKRIEYAAIVIVSRLSQWIPEGGLDDKIVPIWTKLFDEIVGAGVDAHSDLIPFNRQVAEAILSPTDLKAREWIRGR